MFSLRVLTSPKYLVTALVLCVAAPIAAQPLLEQERADTVRQLNEARERVKQLEARLRVIDARRAHEQRAHATDGIAMQGTANCANPFFLDTDGVKHFRVECLVADTRSACETNPFTIDDDGIKRIRPACGQ